MVEDGPLTNSPISFSLSRARFESIPNSAAISCTRGFPATILLSGHSPSQGVPLPTNETHFEPLMRFPLAIQPVLM